MCLHQARTIPGERGLEACATNRRPVSKHESGAAPGDVHTMRTLVGGRRVRAAADSDLNALVVVVVARGRETAAILRR